MNGDSNVPDLGPCCICGTLGDVGNILMLDLRAPEPGTGWGCLVCDLPNDGAVAVLCDSCMELYSNGAPLLDVVAGYPGEGRRMALSKLEPIAFGHRPGVHKEADP